MVNVTQELVFVILTDKLKVSVDKDSEDVFLAHIIAHCGLTGAGGGGIPLHRVIYEPRYLQLVVPPSY